MTTHSRHYIFLTTIFVSGGIGILYYTQIYSYYQQNQLQIDQEKFNTLTPISGSDTIVNTDLRYTLPNGLILFDTTIPSQEFDYDSDNSITKFVSATIALNDKQYTPNDLVPIQSDYLVVNNSNMKLRSIALKKLDELAAEFYTIFNDKIVIVSAYRSYGYQKNIAKGCSPTLCARAGHSEHQLGLSIDIFAATTAGKFLSKAEFKKYYEWLMQNAHRYGRHNSYQKGVSIDSYQPEPRHWRYLGRELATELYNNQQTFTEWYKQEKDID